MHQTLKVKEERRQPETRIEFEPELVHLQHEPQELAHQQQQQQRDKQQSVELKMSAESKEISPVKQEVAPTTVVSMESATSNRCAGCREPIRDKFIFSVIDLNWHQDCVQCADCLLKLNERCHTYEGKLYCRQDYWRRFGPKCFACEQSIERNELVQIIKGNRIYHLKCFTCSECNKQLKAGEQLHLIDGKRLLCKQDFHHQIGCRSPPSSNYPPNNNSNNKSNSCFQSATNSSPHQSQQHTISATYYTLMSNQKQQKQGQVVAAGEQKVQEQTISRRAQKKIESRQQMNAGLSADEADEMDAFEDELEAEADEEAEVDADADADDAELDEEGASLDGVRSMLGFDVDSNLENEENRSVLRFTQQADGALEQAAALSAGLGQQQLLANVSRLRKVAARAESMDGGEVKRRRRRRKKLQTAGGPSEANPAGAKRLTNRNGESILNGMPPASSILAVHGSSAAAATLQHQQQQQQQHQQAGSHQQHNQMLNQPTSNHQKSVPSSAASTASNSSTSSSISLNHQNSNHGSSHHQHHHHHHHQRSQHHEQQPHKQQQQCGQRPSSGQTGGGHKPTRVRTVLNEKQLQTLRDCYAHNPRPDALMKEQLVEMTGLSSRVIRVWFQNKRCKDKKKSIQHKQMLQYEKDGRHLAGLTLMRGVPLVASSPIQYDDHSTVSSTPGPTQQQPQPQPGGAMLELQSTGQLMQQQQSGPDADSSPLMADQQQSNRPGGHFGPASVHSPANPQQPQPVDIHAYQPPWKNLIEYANHGATPPDRLNTASPRYQQLIGQIHGYSGNRTEPEQTEQQQLAPVVSMAELQPQARSQFQQPSSMSFPSATTTNALMDRQQHHPPPPPPPPMGHLHQFQH